MKQSLPPRSEQQIRESQRSADDIALTNKSRSFVNNRPETTAQRIFMDTIHSSPLMMAQRKLVESFHSSSRMVAQRELHRSLQNPSMQLRATPEEELLQGKFGIVQRTQFPAVKPNNARLPGNLRSGIENLSGVSQLQLDIDGQGFTKRTGYETTDDAKYNALLGALNLYHLRVMNAGEYGNPTVLALQEVLNNAKVFLNDYTNQYGDIGRVQDHTKKLIDGTVRELNQVVKKLHDNQVGANDDEKIKETEKDLTFEGSKHLLHILRYQKAMGFKGKESPVGKLAEGPAIIQNWTARGDMYHVKAVMGMFPQLKLIIYDLTKPGKIDSMTQRNHAEEYATEWKQACVMADYYDDSNRVYYTYDTGVSGKGGDGNAYAFYKEYQHQGNKVKEGKNLYIGVGGCTTLLGLTMKDARDKEDRGEEDAFSERYEQMKEAVAPVPTDSNRASKQDIIDCLRAKGFENDTKYMIVNFRDSGHKNIQNKLRDKKGGERDRLIEGYDPKQPTAEGNHPELDSGSLGIRQLGAVAEEKGFKAVYMGEEPTDAQVPNLLEYWSWNWKGKKICRGGRGAEAYLLRVLGEEFNVSYMGLRSGVTDQIAMAGIPIISIDLDLFHRKSAPEIIKNPGYKVRDDVGDSWGRGSKLEAGLGRRYGRVFLQHGRSQKEFTDDGRWEGGYHKEDLANIGDAIDFYFGDEDKGGRHKTHPLHPEQIKLTASKGKESKEQMTQNLQGIIDTSMNPEVVLAQAKTLIGDGKIEANNRQALNFLMTHMEYTPIPLNDSEKSKEEGYQEMRNRKIEEKKQFGDKAIKMLPDNLKGIFLIQTQDYLKLSNSESARKVRDNLPTYNKIKSCIDSILTEFEYIRRRYFSDEKQFGFVLTELDSYRQVTDTKLGVLQQLSGLNELSQNESFFLKDLRREIMEAGEKLTENISNKLEAKYGKKQTWGYYDAMSKDIVQRINVKNQVLKDL